MRINEDLMTTAESSPSGHNGDDANVSPYPALCPEALAPPAPRRSSGFFAEEDDLISLPRVVAKVKASSLAPLASASVPPSSNNHPIHAAVDFVVDFADQFVRLEVENAQLCKAAKSSADQVQEANRLAAEARNENSSLKEELKQLKKKKMKEEQESRLKAFIEAGKKEGALRKSIESLLNTADMPVDRTNKLRVDSMSDALSFAAESNQNKTLGELVNTFFIDSSSAIEDGNRNNSGNHGNYKLRPQRTPELPFAEQINAPCYLHSYIDSKDNKTKSSHLLRDCRQFLDMEKLIRQKQQQPPPPPPQHQVQQAQPHQPNEIFPPPRGQMSMIHRTSVSRREMKKLTREINLAESIMANIPEYVEWSSQNITFSRADHPMTIPKPGHAALVVEAQIGGFKMSKVFMHGGSGLNLIFIDTIKSMGITMRMLEETDTCFHGILPTSPAYSLGKVYLNVVFGKTDNFRKEKIEFEVVNWESQYHAILGRPAYSKFMAVPHYAYLKLKMQEQRDKHHSLWKFFTLGQL
ncbi:hypothetical protein QYE76_050763 [Lolium multiflorum]|uniref:Uncharacterized protein n=1 Tax=Lolium multiflorum TaxID=4521 RepID=A0AAD8WHL9_LOLMU|nr:hypothetical protein QYE76_050763 [Lolium multiflorum]